MMIYNSIDINDDDSDENILLRYLKGVSKIAIATS